MKNQQTWGLGVKSDLDAWEIDQHPRLSENSMTQFLRPFAFSDCSTVVIGTRPLRPAVMFVFEGEQVTMCNP